MRIIAVMLFCLALLIASGPVARADDQQMFCHLLDINHGPAGVMHAIGFFLDRGYGIDATVIVVDDAISMLCPWYADDVAFADRVYRKGMRV